MDNLWYNLTLMSLMGIALIGALVCVLVMAVRFNRGVLDYLKDADNKKENHHA